MKIGFLIYSLQGGGAERMVSRLANDMTGKGNEVSIFLLDDTNQAYNLNKEVKIRSCKVRKEKNKILRIIKGVSSIRKIFKEERPDVVLAFTISMVPFALVGSIGLPIKIIGAERTNPKVLSKAYKLAVKLASPFCDGYIFQTKGARNCYPKIVQKKSIVIGNIAPSIEIKNTNIFAENIKICSVGRLNKDKDFQTLVKAFYIFVQKYPNTLLSIFGDGNQKSELQEMVHKLGINEKVIFNGFVTNITDRMQEHNIFVFSSKAEGMPNALLEAMASGLDCISTDCKFGPSDLIEEGSNGWLVPVGDSEAIANRVEWIVNHPEKHLEICKNAAEVQKHYSVDAIVGQYLGFINLILRKTN
jgi:GalNAc-alpha-(1->4)-GalNAc-alpha-(1->3)-diNAcBac-PP-undecaprenol alpha-1,4-N-acetyl-D-galactosaminyltransferase